MQSWRLAVGGASERESYKLAGWPDSAVVITIDECEREYVFFFFFIITLISNAISSPSSSSSSTFCPYTFFCSLAVPYYSIGFWRMYHIHICIIAYAIVYRCSYMCGLEPAVCVWDGQRFGFHIFSATIFSGCFTFVYWCRHLRVPPPSLVVLVLLTPPATIVAAAAVVVGVTYIYVDWYREPGRWNKTVHSSPCSFCMCMHVSRMHGVERAAHIIHSIRTVYLMRNWITHR